MEFGYPQKLILPKEHLQSQPRKYKGSIRQKTNVINMVSLYFNNYIDLIIGGTNITKR